MRVINQSVSLRIPPLQRVFGRLEGGGILRLFDDPTLKGGYPEIPVGVLGRAPKIRVLKGGILRHFFKRPLLKGGVFLVIQTDSKGKMLTVGVS